MLTLIQPAPQHSDVVMAFRQEFLDQGERISGGIGLENTTDYLCWLRHETTPHYGKVDEAVFLA